MAQIMSYKDLGKKFKILVRKIIKFVCLIGELTNASALSGKKTSFGSYRDLCASLNLGLAD